ncbi:GTPase [Marinobacter nanhaiticus D15-8W]|uniref:GTPase n=1 Tax=Marinobacter nanhaiticus D15-8W TaxID=626887 RepID=N6WP31_9GAMM|nr:GTPase [Marinobacter nanhaiticus D15-8W]
MTVQAGYAQGVTLKPDLTLPEQKIANLSFCDATPKSFGRWVSALPVANLGETSRQLYHAVIELNQLIIAPQQRLQLLELIRPRINFVCRELSRHYLGLSIALPEKQRKIANLSQALQLHLANGYKTTLIELLDAGPLDKYRKAITTACHRIITDLGHTILRAHQLYCPSPARSWLECHRVFRFALRNKLQDGTVEDDTLMHRKASSIADTYKRLLLLGCARPNQLRQNELVQAYELFEVWTSHVNCSMEQLESALFLINMEQDGAPIYKSLIQPDQLTRDCLGFDTLKLSSAISEHLSRRSAKHEPEPELSLPANISDNLLMHLSQALGNLTKRNFKRVNTQGSLQVCVGLTAAHYFIAGEKTFKQFIASGDVPSREDDNFFLKQARRRNDAWADAHDAGPSNDFSSSADTPITFRGAGGSVETDEAPGNRPKTYRTPLVNTSPGGYCVSWEGEIPPSLQAGEVLAVREHNAHPWSVAVVRWIRQLRNQGTQIGIELLAPSASPCGVRLIQKVGNSSEYLRGLLLPEVSVIGQPATLITPRLPFQQGSRIVLRQGEREDNGQLSKRISATGSISQFELRLQSRSTDSTSQPSSPDKTSEDEFDSLWPSL